MKRRAVHFDGEQFRLEGQIELVGPAADPHPVLAPPVPESGDVEDVLVAPDLKLALAT